MPHKTYYEGSSPGKRLRAAIRREQWTDSRGSTMDDRRGAGATLDVPATAGIARAAVDGALPGALLLAKLGHELRSPLTGIVGLTRIMLVKLAEGAHTPGQQTHQLELMRA